MKTELEELFPPLPGRRLQMRLLAQGGRLRLALPADAAAAACALSLFPAQRPAARLAKAVLRMAARLGLPLPLPKSEIALGEGDPLAGFLAGLAGDKAAGLSLAVCPGNPNTPGRRWVVAVFGSGVPVAVAKAGITPEARALIEKEEQFLRENGGAIAGIPALRATLDSARARAFATEFAEGDPPRNVGAGQLGAWLGRWIDGENTVSLGETPAWCRLAADAKEAPGFDQLAGLLAGRRIHPALMHGDFAPWNVKVSPEGTWKVLDWERGERLGVPGWDWFHFVLQPAVLVDRLAPAALARVAEELLGCPALQAYLDRAGMAGLGRPLLAAYLLHCTWSLKVTEGAGSITALGALLSKSWPGR